MRASSSRLRLPRAAIPQLGPALTFSSGRPQCACPALPGPARPLSRRCPGAVREGAGGPGRAVQCGQKDWLGRARARCKGRGPSIRPAGRGASLPALWRRTLCHLVLAGGASAREGEMGGRQGGLQTDPGRSPWCEEGSPGPKDSGRGCPPALGSPGRWGILLGLIYRVGWGRATRPRPRGILRCASGCFRDATGGRGWVRWGAARESPGWVTLLAWACAPGTGTHCVCHL